jgi:plasmid stabilization system protein ParE
MKRVTFHPEAKAEGDAAIDWYLARSESAALELAKELKRAYGTLRKNPKICPIYLRETRRVILDRYPFSVVLREVASGVQIVAIAHAKRRPGNWAKRLKQ